MKKLFILLSLIVLLSIPQTTLGAGINASCPDVYGVSCPSGNILLNKLIKNPQTGEWVDSLSASSVTFLAGQEVNFRIEVKNIGQTDLDNVSVEDKLPDFLDFVQGPGSFDKNSKTLKWSIDKLRVGESKLFDIKAKVTQNLPDMGLSCVTNFAQAKKDQMVAQDTSLFCIQTKILGEMRELPKTGISEITNMLLISFATFISSVYIFRKVKSI